MRGYGMRCLPNYKQILEKLRSKYNITLVCVFVGAQILIKRNATKYPKVYVYLMMDHE